MYLIGEEGPLEGSLFELLSGDSWSLGRSRDVTFLIADPMVSRKHAVITKEDGLFFIENLSTTGRTIVNGEEIEDKKEIKDGDMISIGSSLLKVSYEEETSLTSVEEVSPFIEDVSSDWVLKIVGGPNSGAEFPLNEGSYTFGKDISCDIVIQDLSTSGKHLKIDISDDIFIEDLSSKNGVYINGLSIEKATKIDSDDVVSAGTTSFIIVSVKHSRSTLYSAPVRMSSLPKKKSGKSIKDLLIPTKHLFLIPILLLASLISAAGVISLFRGEVVSESSHRNIEEELRDIFRNFDQVEFFYSDRNRNLLLTGHVITELSYEELQYRLSNLPINNLTNNIIVDEKVWEEMNSLISNNPMWRSVYFSSLKAGSFTMRGYVKDDTAYASLREYVILYFPYPNLLDDEVIVESRLASRISSLLIRDSLSEVTFDLMGGEVTLEGKINIDRSKVFDSFLKELSKINGVRRVTNLVIRTNLSTKEIDSIDLSNKYNVSGVSYCDDNAFVLINGKVLSTGDLLDGMTISSIDKKVIMLDKDGIKYKIDYNLQ